MNPIEFHEKTGYWPSFDDTTLMPGYSEVESRSNVSLTSNVGSLDLDIPIIGAPMDTVCGPEMCAALAKSGATGVLHRYNTIEEQIKMVSDANTKGFFVAIGATGDYKERAAALYEQGVRSFCIDVAHGHHVLVRNALGHLRSTYGEDIDLMAGNIASERAARDLIGWGANVLRVGVGGGSCCTTRVRTGFGIPTLSSVALAAKVVEQEQKLWDADISIVADGGIRTSGDMVKCFAVGADAVMVGSLLSGLKETPGEVLDGPSGPYKEFRGMASSKAQKQWRGSVSVAEGVSTTVTYRNVSAHDVLDSLAGGVRSGFSYAGATTKQDFFNKVEMTYHTQNGAAEAKPHVLS